MLKDFLSPERCLIRTHDGFFLVCMHAFSAHFYPINNINPNYMYTTHLYALLATFAVGGVGLASCSSDEAVDNNPTFDGKAVKTQFAVNIPVAGAKHSRQTVAVTQAEEPAVFKGMQGIYLASVADAAVADASTFTSVFRLPNIAAITEANSAKIYNDVEVPVGTRSFLFYGTSSSTGAQHETGVLRHNLSDNTVMSTAAVNFNLQPIVADVTTLDATKTALLKALNDVLSVSGWSTFTPGVDKAERDLQEVYQEVTKPGIHYLGSAAGIKSLLSDLKASLESITGLSGAAQTLRDAVLAKAIAGITAVEAQAGFPETLGIPQGAVQIVCTAGTYAYVDNASVTFGEATLPTSSLCYPASLNYTVATTARAKNEKVSWQEAVSDWKNQFAGWGNEVLSSTRTIALYDNIQYSVARLDVAAKLKEGVVGIEDNAKALAGAAENQRINGSKFTVSGVLIGGQPTLANWQVLPAPTAQYNLAIYDRVVNSTATISTTTTDYCKTLVLDNKATTGDEKTVHVVLELVNGSGADFYGSDGVIKSGAKFYMVAKLDPAVAIAAGTHNGQNHVFVQDHVTKVVFTLDDKCLSKSYVGVPDLRSADLELGLSVDLKWQRGMEFEIAF